MGFEAYTVVLVPCHASSRELGRSTNPNKDYDKGAVQHVVNDMQQEWPVLRADETELRSLISPLAPGEVCLVYKTVQGLIQLMLTPYCGQVSLSLRFAYCNPRSVYQPFMAIIVWLMERYQMCAYVVASDNLPDLNDAQEIEAVLVPRMDHNRCLWQQDARTSEEALLRPGDAIQRFVRAGN